MAVARAEIPVSYKTTINRTVTRALRDVFTSTYPDSDFQNLNIVVDYPLSEAEYPAIICRYREGPIPNAGVGHAEYFPAPDGSIRKWKHRRFEGTMEFLVSTLSPLDRDVLSDALVEILSFGDLDSLLNNFFVRVYGELGVEVGTLGLLHQISLNTDRIDPTGESATIAPWQPEDVMVYTNGYTLQCNGGFYNSYRPSASLGYIQNAIIEPYIDLTLIDDEDPNNQWSFVFDYDDFGAIQSAAVISST